MKTLFILIFLTIIVVACSEKEPPVTDLKKDHAIEVTYQTKHLDGSLDLLIRKENVYLRGQLVKSFTRTDTLPAAGDTLQLVEHNDTSQYVKMPKEYEFFVTIK
jgi:hypothetical protein